MNTITSPRRFEFVSHGPENRILVERGDNAVVIRAAKNNFSARRKCLFIREMAAEGFVPDDLQAITEGEIDWREDLNWIVDGSWVAVGMLAKQARRRQVLRTVSVATVLWLELMGLLFVVWQ